MIISWSSPTGRFPTPWLAAHPDALVHVADSVEAGVTLASQLAGEGLVCVSAGNIGGQAFSSSWSTRFKWTSPPVVLGNGVRFFGDHAGTVVLDDPDQVVQGDRVLHLHYILGR